MNKIFRNILALFIAIVPLNAWMIWNRIINQIEFTSNDLTIYPLVIGGGMVIVILFLNKYLLESDFNSTFNSSKGKLLWDINIGIGLTIIYFIEFFISRVTVYRWIPNTFTSNQEIGKLLIDLAGNTWLMLFWFVFVLWIGIALYEELMRIFLFKCLKNISGNNKGTIIAILITSAIVGFLHIYQGYAGVISIGLKSIIMLLFFIKYERILPLIISHGLYDGLQFYYFIMQVQN